MPSLAKFKARIIEFIKYDYNQFKLPLVLVSFVVIMFIHCFFSKKRAFEFASSLYRTGWQGSDRVGLFFAKKFASDKNYAKAIIDLEIQSATPLPNTAKFFENPSMMLGGILIILKSPKNDEKGIIVLKYSVYFILFQKFFDLNHILSKYILIIEPSWAGLCDIGVLSYTKYSDDVFVMCYEERDFQLISSINSNLHPIKVGPSWFVNYEQFRPYEDERKIDVIMVAAWARFKRHEQFLKRIKDVVKKKDDLKVVLIGYPVNMTLHDIEGLVESNGLSNNVTIFDSIAHSRVSELLRCSKVNILWSKFEGNNRSIIEGMFCDTSVILRKGHNYGEHYDYINDSTGTYADEADLAEQILERIATYNSFSPRKYVLENRNCVLATEIINNTLSKNEIEKGRPWSEGAVAKVNTLDRMEYFRSEDSHRFKDDYTELSTWIYAKN